MTRKRATTAFSDSDVLDTLYSDRTSRLAEELRQAAHGNEDLHVARDQWEHITRTLRVDRTALDAIGRTATDRAMRAIRSDASSNGIKPRRSALAMLGGRSWTLAGALGGALTLLFFVQPWRSLPDRDSSETTSGTRGEDNQSASSTYALNHQSFQTDSPDVFVDFLRVGPGQGTSNEPHPTLVRGLMSTPKGGKLYIKTGRTKEGLLVDKPVTLVAWGGPVVIGAPD